MAGYALIKSAMRSPIMIAGAFVLARGQSGMIEWSSFELMESVSQGGSVTYRPIVKDF